MRVASSNGIFGERGLDEELESGDVSDGSCWTTYGLLSLVQAPPTLGSWN